MIRPSELWLIQHSLKIDNAQSGASLPRAPPWNSDTPLVVHSDDREGRAGAAVSGRGRVLSMILSPAHERGETRQRSPPPSPYWEARRRSSFCCPDSAARASPGRLLTKEDAALGQMEPPPLLGAVASHEAAGLQKPSWRPSPGGRAAPQSCARQPTQGGHPRAHGEAFPLAPGCSSSGAAGGAGACSAEAPEVVAVPLPSARVAARASARKRAGEPPQEEAESGSGAARREGASERARGFGRPHCTPGLGLLTSPTHSSSPWE